MATIKSRIQMKRDITANWNAKTSFIPLEGEIIVYLDYDVTSDGKLIPGIKIGDGKAYLIDLPFTNANLVGDLTSHISDTTAHITQEERDYWNSKIDAEVNDEELHFFR